MKWTHLLSLSLLSAIVANAIFPSAATSLRGRTYIVALTGNVQIKRRWWLGYRQVSMNETLWREDRLWVRNVQSAATIICNSNPRHLWQVPRRQDVPVTEGCPEAFYRDEDSLAPGRDPKNENLPYLIRPRNTALFPDQPLSLRWNPVDGATYYDVVIKNLSRPVWETRVSEPIAEYPDVDELERDLDYSVVITANTGASAPEDPALDPVPTFSLLSDEQVEEVRAELAEIEDWGLEDEVKAFARADLYRRYRLYQSGVDVLELVIEAGSENVAIHQLLAELYLEVDLPWQAKESYLIGLDFAKAEGDFAHQQAEIQEQLGLISHYLADFEEAVNWLREAETNYRELLDPTIRENQEKLTKIEALIQSSQELISDGD